MTRRRVIHEICPHFDFCWADSSLGWSSRAGSIQITAIFSARIQVLFLLRFPRQCHRAMFTVVPPPVKNLEQVFFVVVSLWWTTR
jgi:hypothetical protein